MGSSSEDEKPGSDFELNASDHNEEDDNPSDEEVNSDDLEEEDEEEEDDFNPFGSGSEDDEDPWARRKRKANKKAAAKKVITKKAKAKNGSAKKPVIPDTSFAHLYKSEDKKVPLPSQLAPLPGLEPHKPYVPPRENIDRACQMKQEILAKIEDLGRILPPNTLDHLIDELGGPENVSEMTGRKGRVVQDQTSGDVRYESRSEADIPLETLNLTEKDRFMNGEKDVAIISEAASSGISLQADRRVKNQVSPRLHSKAGIIANLNKFSEKTCSHDS